MQQKEVEILLIEDNLMDAEMTIRALRKNNFCNKLVHLKDGAEALEFLFANVDESNADHRLKVILLDLKMPKVDGIEVLRAIKENEKTKKIPVVILTSSKEHPDVEKCYELGANSYIVKPVDFEGFHKAVTELGFYWLLLNQDIEK